jgi:hypothetical protein
MERFRTPRGGSGWRVTASRGCLFSMELDSGNILEMRITGDEPRPMLHRRRKDDRISQGQFVLRRHIARQHGKLGIEPDNAALIEEGHHFHGVLLATLPTNPTVEFALNNRGHQDIIKAQRIGRKSAGQGTVDEAFNPSARIDQNHPDSPLSIRSR